MIKEKTFLYKLEVNKQIELLRMTKKIQILQIK